MTGRADASLSCTLAAAEGGAPLVLLPSVGTTPLSLVRLARALVPPRPVLGFAYAGLEDDRTPHGSIEAIARANVDELLATRRERVWLIGGHCLGSAVAWAIAQELLARGERVRGVVVLDGFAPVARGFAPDDIAGSEAAARRAVDEVVRRTLEHAARLERATFDRLATLLKAHIQAGVDYRAPSLDLPLRVLRSAAMDDVMFAGWPRLAAGGVATEVVAGDTFSMLRPPAVEGTGRALGRALFALE